MKIGSFGAILDVLSYFLCKLKLENYWGFVIKWYYQIYHCGFIINDTKKSEDRFNWKTHCWYELVLALVFVLMWCVWKYKCDKLTTVMSHTSLS